MNTYRSIMDSLVPFSYKIVQAVACGLFTGLLLSLFVNALDRTSAFIASLDNYFWALPLVFLISHILIRNHSKDTLDKGTDQIVSAMHTQASVLQKKSVPIRILATFITLIFGGSAGKAGPSAQLDASIQDLVAGAFSLSAHLRRRMIVYGVSAGFTVVFGTPIAGTILAGKIIFGKSFVYRKMIPAFVSSTTALMVSRWFDVSNFKTVIGYQLDFPLLFFVILSGIFFSLHAVLFILLLDLIEQSVKKAKGLHWFKPLVGGFLVLLIPLIFQSTQSLGLGLETIENALMGESLPLYESYLKMFTTSVTLSFGGSGGILTPILFFGATFGNFFGSLFHLNPALFAAIGMGAFLSATTNTPFAAVILVTELFGLSVGLLAVPACAISYFIVRHMSVYPSQILRKNTTLLLNEEANQSFNIKHIIRKINKKDRKKRS